MKQIVDELKDHSHIEDAIHLLENTGNYQQACEMMIEKGNSPIK